MRVWTGVTAFIAAMLLAVPGAGAAQTSQSLRFTASDGVSLAVTVYGEAPLTARPAVMEVSPYGNSSHTYDPPAAYNRILVQTRGTGDSDGSFDALGPRTQQDVAELTRWVCRQPWSDGTLALEGFSASAITIYNSLHLPLDPCVEALLLGSGTFELYRDLLVPGGINNIAPGTAVVAGIGAIALSQGFDRAQRNPASAADLVRGFLEAGLQDLTNPSLTAWWQQRGYRGNANHIPALMTVGFFDVESRGAFQGYQELRGDGAHLLVLNGHDGAPKGTDGGQAEKTAWIDHYLRGIDNGVEDHPRAQLYLSDGDREDFTVRGRYVTTSATDWPVPGTTWTPLQLDAARAGSALSGNDGSLSLGRPAAQTLQAFASLPSLFTATDVPTTATVGGAGLNALADALPILTDTTLAGALGLTYTTPKLTRDVWSAGPASLELKLRSTAPETGVWAVISDVDTNSTPHPLAVGRLSTAYPDVIASRSLTRDGTVVQPYGDYAARKPATPGVERAYKVELWPVGNRFRAGHRIRLDIVGQSLLSLPTAPALNTIKVGGTDGARLLLPVLPGSDLTAALPAATPKLSLLQALLHG